MQAASAATGGLMGAIFGGMNDRRQIKQQGKLNQLQEESSKRMMDYQNIKAMDMWQKTNYSAQLAEMKKAGLSTGLMYGGSGPGGATTGSASSSIGGGQAPAGGGEVQTMAMQLGLQQAQIENIKANTEKTKIEAAKTAGVDTELGQTQVEANRIANDIAAQTKDKTIEGIGYDVSKKWKELSLLTYQEQVEGNEDVLNARIKGAQEGYMTAALTNKEIIAKTGLSEEQAKAVAASVVQKWAEIGQGNMKLAIETFRAEIEANRPGLWNVLGGQVQEIIEGLYDLGGVRDNTRYKQKIKK